MPIVTQILCGGCGAVKKETNHWFAVAILEHGVLLRPLDVALLTTQVGQRAGREEYYCGQKCALEAMTQWMESPLPGSAWYK